MLRTKQKVFQGHGDGQSGGGHSGPRSHSRPIGAMSTFATVRVEITNKSPWHRQGLNRQKPGRRRVAFTLERPVDDREERQRRLATDDVDEPDLKPVHALSVVH